MLASLRGQLREVGERRRQDGAAGHGPHHRRRYRLFIAAEGLLLLLTVLAVWGWVAFDIRAQWVWLLVTQVGSLETYWRLSGGPSAVSLPQPEPPELPDFPASMLWRDVRHILKATNGVWASA